ncbi:MAG: hypothetical protein KGI29_00475 [Pseudomonadota bacterium]|nr:hypothetical protein [Pseudomonadota bacterium]MDE3038295.1 hypothetical protein [Pseudomonadota bacterium]
MPRSDIPFNADDAHAFLPWIIGIMACMATLLLCLGVTVGGWIIDHHNVYANSFTVTLPVANDDHPAKTSDVQKALQIIPGVSNVNRVSENRLREMLKPWIGNSDGTLDLPLPTVFDVTLRSAAAVNYDAVQKQIAAITPGAEVDGHERWIASFANFSAVAQSIVAGLAMVIICGLGLIIAFTCRAALKLHGRTVQLLHSIGAEDNYIMRQFQREAVKLALYGAAPGALAAGLVYWGAGIYVASLRASLLPALPMTMTHLALILLMPPCCGGVAWTAARLSVIRQLREVL